VEQQTSLNDIHKHPNSNKPIQHSVVINLAEIIPNNVAASFT
jgi:hypothetical protein